MIIRLANATDAPFLPAVERSAGEAFRATNDLAWIADADDLPVERYAALIAGGATWVATDDDGNIAGFLCGEIFGDELHIWEMSVRADAQRAGLGTRLIETATAWAAAAGLRRVTLTTFREVAWGGPGGRRRGGGAGRGGRRGPRRAE